MGSSAVVCLKTSELNRSRQKVSGFFETHPVQPSLPLLSPQKFNNSTAGELKVFGMVAGEFGNHGEPEDTVRSSSQGEAMMLDSKFFPGHPNLGPSLGPGLGGA